MHTAYKRALAAALAATGLSALAQTLAGAADPVAAVPATTYRPAISYRPEADAETPPDQNWAASNATVAAYDSMSLTMKMKMKGMQAHGAMAPADPHAGHSEHAGHAGHASAPTSQSPMPMPMPPKESP